MNLLKLRFERAPVPDPGVLKRCGVLFQIGRVKWLAGDGELALFDKRSSKIVGLAGTGNAPDEIWQFKGDLVWTD